MKVLMVIPSISMGGAQLGVLKIIKALRAANTIEFDILSAQGFYRYDREIAQQFEDQGAALYFLPHIYPYGRFPYRVARALRGIVESAALFWIMALFRNRYDVIHLHTIYSIDIFAVAARASGQPSVITFQGAIEDGRLDRVRRGVRVFRESHSVYTAVSEATKLDCLAKTGLRSDAITVIPNAVDLGQYAPLPAVRRTELRRQLQIDDDCVVFGTVGRLSAEKGHQLLVDSARLLKAIRTDFCVLIAGDGPARAQLETQLADLNLENHVRILGFRNDVPDLLQSFDVFVLPSYTEGLSNALIEALVSGLPCVATDVGGNSEVISNDVGILVEPEPQSVFQGMLRLMNKQVREDYRAKAVGSAARFDINTIAHSYYEQYMELSGIEHAT